MSKYLIGILSQGERIYTGNVPKWWNKILCQALVWRVKFESQSYMFDKNREHSTIVSKEMLFTLTACVRFAADKQRTWTGYSRIRSCYISFESIYLTDGENHNEKGWGKEVFDF
jgi:hypothetical protein